MNFRALAFAFMASSLLLSGCATAPEKSASTRAADDPYPAWFYQPGIADGLGAASCVTIHQGNMSVAQKQATANGRAALAQQIESRVKAMDKTYDRVTESNEGASVGGSFESVSKQVTQQHLSGSRAVEFARVSDGDLKKLCAHVTLAPEQTNQLLDALVGQSELNLSPTNESIIREQFLAYKATQEMDAEIQQRQ